ncbi:flavodoxin FldB [Agaribacter flavus]|uniref:Flavodoxin n=1 Tax=Agaribacter flavus TaxID=1902781 RepID=A0ABV7FRT9_9ALTE
MRIAIFYGSTTCYTEMAGEKIQETLHTLTAQTIPMFNIKDTALKKCEEFDFIVFGISTWDFGELQEDWESTWDDIRSLQLTGKKVAIYGLGDQLGYADWFQDALGMLHDEVVALDADIIGYWPNEGYEFAASKALTADQTYFVGLSLDDENQFDLSHERIQQWCTQIVEEYTQ